MSMFHDDVDEADVPTPRTIRDTIGLRAVLVLLLLATIVLALVGLDPARAAGGEPRTYCVGGTTITVTDGGRHAGGACR